MQLQSEASLKIQKPLFKKEWACYKINTVAKEPDHQKIIELLENPRILQKNLAIMHEYKIMKSGCAASFLEQEPRQISCKLWDGARTSNVFAESHLHLQTRACVKEVKLEILL